MSLHWRDLLTSFYRYTPPPSNKNSATSRRKLPFANTARGTFTNWRLLSSVTRRPCRVCSKGTAVRRMGVRCCSIRTLCWSGSCSKKASFPVQVDILHPCPLLNPDPNAEIGVQTELRLKTGAPGATAKINPVPQNRHQNLPGPSPRRDIPLAWPPIMRRSVCSCRRTLSRLVLLSKVPWHVLESTRKV